MLVQGHEPSKAPGGYQRCRKFLPCPGARLSEDLLKDQRGGEGNTVKTWNHRYPRYETALFSQGWCSQVGSIPRLIRESLGGYPRYKNAPTRNAGAGHVSFKSLRGYPHYKQRPCFQCLCAPMWPSKTSEGNPAMRPPPFSQGWCSRPAPLRPQRVPPAGRTPYSQCWCGPRVLRKARGRCSPTRWPRHLPRMLCTTMPTRQAAAIPP